MWESRFQNPGLRSTWNPLALSGATVHASWLTCSRPVTVAWHNRNRATLTLLSMCRSQATDESERLNTLGATDLAMWRFGSRPASLVQDVELTGRVISEFAAQLLDEFREYARGRRRVHPVRSTSGGSVQPNAATRHGLSRKKMPPPGPLLGGRARCTAAPVPRLPVTAWSFDGQIAEHEKARVDAPRRDFRCADHWR